MPYPNGQMNFTTTPYNQSNYYLPSGQRENYGEESSTSFNKQLIETFWDKGLSMIDDSNLDSPAIFTTTQVDSFDLPRFIGTISDAFSKNTGYLLKAVESAKTGNVFNLDRFAPVAPKLEYIRADNGDQNRVFGILMNDTENQSAFRFVITKVTIDRYNADNGTNVTALPASATRIYLGPDPLNPNYNTNYLAPMLSGCYSCRPNSCGKGYRMLYLSKNVNQLLDPTVAFPQTAIPGQTMDEVVIVQSVEDAGDGGAYFNWIRNTNRQNIDGNANTSGLVFRNTSISLAPGDQVYVGTFAPSTECIEAPKECQTYQPKYYKYCSNIREYVDCIGCVNKTRFRTHQFPHDIMDPFQQLSYQVIRNYKNYWHRVNNDIMLGSPNYAQGYPFPPSNTGVGASTNGEIIPFNVNGIIPQFDAFARKLQITLTGCDQICQLQALETLISSLDRGSSNGLDSIYNDPGWILVGDVEFFDRYYANQITNYIPNTAADRQEQINLMRQSYSSKPVSLIRAQNEKDTILSNQFDQQINKYGIKLSSLQIGKYTFKALHDRGLSNKNPGVVRLMHIPSIAYFTDAQDEYMGKIFGRETPFLPSSSVRGQMLPSIVSYDMISSYIDGDIHFKANRDCPISLFSYMRTGVRIKPKMFPFMMKIQFNSAIANPSYNPADPLSSPYIYGDVYNLNCGCMKALRTTELTLEPWLNPAYTPAS